ASIVTYVIGGTLLAGGVVLSTLGLTRGDAPPAVACAPAGLGMTCAGSF
ncbi:MAG: hypothetical protein IT378_09920, partial [Sandaracinaceae bacterium]|nr:hypothetical protein [Sandaracinaceae bacterium]